MSLDRLVIKETPYPERMSWDLVEKWAGIPRYSENDPANPEWRPTPTIPLQLPDNAIVYVKDESDAKSNPNRIAKDRPSWEVVCDHRDYAQRLLNQKARINSTIETLSVPRVSILTATNAGYSLAKWFERFNLPPPKMVIDIDTEPAVIAALTSLRTDIYQVDFSKRALTGRELQQLSNNANGIELTSERMREPQAHSYDWQFHESVNERPFYLFVPYGSGTLFENYITWQKRNLQMALAGGSDPRLQITAEALSQISIIGVEPESPSSKANKLAAQFKPFVLYKRPDFDAMKTLKMTGKLTGVYQVPESLIEEAYESMNGSFLTSPSGAAGLAGYLLLKRQGLLDPAKKSLVVNTGPHLLPPKPL